MQLINDQIDEQLGTLRRTEQQNIARLRVLTTGRAVGGDWQVLSGLKPGDRLIVVGQQKATPDMPVTPTPAKS